MIEQIAGPGSLSILSCKLFKAQDLHLTKDYLLPMKESKLAADRLVTSWGEWLSLAELTEQNLAPDVWRLLIHRLAVIYKDSFVENPVLHLLWDQRFIFYELSKIESTYTVLIDQPKLITVENGISKTEHESKEHDFAEETIDVTKATQEKSARINFLASNSVENSKLAESFFQALLEQYLLNLTEMNEEAERWLLARDKPWPGLIEAILNESIVQGSPQYPMRRIEMEVDQSPLPKAIPLACLTQKVPGKDQLKPQDLFWLEGDVIIGSSPENADYLLRSSLVMSEHARIWEEGGVYKLMHIGASGSVKINGKIIKKAEVYELPSGCQIQVGDCTFFFYYETELYESKDLCVA